MPNTQSQQQNPACPRCRSKFTIKKGRRQNRFRILQVFQCRECLYKFTAAAGKNKTYPPGVILETVSIYNFGNSLSDTQRALNLYQKIQEAGLAFKRFWFTELAPVLPDEPGKILQLVFFMPKDFKTGTLYSFRD
jgi:ribosomal protein L37AE/L43A